MDSLRVCAQLRGIQKLEYVGIFVEMLENKKNIECNKECVQMSETTH